MSLFHLRDAMPLYHPATHQLAAVLGWIQTHVPCFAGEVPGEWTDAVITKLLSYRVTQSVIAEAMALARTTGYVFAQTSLRMRLQPLEKNFPNVDLSKTKPPSMGTAPPMTEENARRQIDAFERSYVRARSAGDAKAMNSAVEGVAALIWALLKMRAKLKGEQNTFHEVGQRVLTRAPNIAAEIRARGPSQPMPQPDGLRGRRIIIPPRPPIRGR